MKCLEGIYELRWDWLAQVEQRATVGLEAVGLIL